MESNALDIFYQVVVAGVPYVITWRIGIYVVNTLVNWVTGYDDRL